MNERKKNLSYEFYKDYAVLNIPHFDYYDSRSKANYMSDIDSFFLEVKNRNVENLIIDLQGNTGGDPYSADYLYGYLVDETYRYFQLVPDEKVNDYYLELFYDLEPEQNAFKGEHYIIR